MDFGRLFQRLVRVMRSCFGVREPLDEYPDDWWDRPPAQHAPTSSEEESDVDPVAAVKAMRRTGLRAGPARVGIMPSARFPDVYGVYMEFSLDDWVSTVVGICDGNASLYTDVGFAILDGVCEESVRDAAVAFVTQAAEFAAEAIPAKRFPYPEPGRIRFYLLTFDGVKQLDADLEEAMSGLHRYSSLLTSGNELFTQLRRMAETRVAERN